jgi:hypothetical protein
MPDVRHYNQNTGIEIQNGKGSRHALYSNDGFRKAREMTDPKPAQMPELKERLDKIQQRLVDAGYKDVKLHVVPGATLEQALTDAAVILEAVLDGKTRPLEPFNDSLRSDTPVDRERVREAIATIQHYSSVNETAQGEMQGEFDAALALLQREADR